MVPTKIKPRYKLCVRLRRDPWAKLHNKNFRRKKWRISRLLRRSRKSSQLNIWYSLLSRFPQYLRYKSQRILHIRQTWKLFYGSLQDFKIKKFSKKSYNWKTFFKRQEARLDVVLFRCHLFSTVSEGRQWINHGHVFVNGKKSFANRILKKGDIIELDSILKSKLQNHLAQFQRRNRRRNFFGIHKPIPNWVDFDSQSFRILVVTKPDISEICYPFKGDPQSIFAFYRH
jgi:small subunit ribosomal protein S4